MHQDALAGPVDQDTEPFPARAQRHFGLFALGDVTPADDNVTGFGHRTDEKGEGPVGARVLEFLGCAGLEDLCKHPAPVFRRRLANSARQLLQNAPARRVGVQQLAIGREAQNRLRVLLREIRQVPYLLFRPLALGHFPGQRRGALLDPLLQALVGLLQRLFAPEEVDVLPLEDAVGAADDQEQHEVQKPKYQQQAGGKSGRGALDVGD